MSASAPSATPSSASNGSKPRGAFILLEGLDRSGKTSQCVQLAANLNAASPSSTVQMRFPDRTTAIGQMIDSYLKQSAHIDDHAIHLMFSANRWEAQAGMIKALEAGQHLVVDRYAYSGVAFSGSKVHATPPLSLDWAAASDRGLPAPDVVIFLDISTEAAAARGSFGAERYETTEIQTRVREAFKTLRGMADPAANPEGTFGRGVSWRVVDAGQTREQVEADIMRLAQETIERVAKEQTPIKYL